jgi:predicted membrane protein
MILPPPDESSQRRIRRARVLSYVLVALAAVVFSLRPDLFGDPQAQPWHALLHVWRIVVGLLLGVAALAVQVVVGVQWRRGLRRAADD